MGPNEFDVSQSEKAARSPTQTAITISKGMDSNDVLTSK